MSHRIIALLIAAWSLMRTGNPIMPAYWVVVAAVVSLLAALFLMRETRDEVF